jgi:hypothetical protein
MTTQNPIDPHHGQGSAKVKRVEVYWHAVTYKTVAVYILLLGALVFGALYFISPNWYSVAIAKLDGAVGDAGTGALPLSQTQAKFVNLDGKVQVKKVNSVQWVDADYRTTLDKGDLIQTGGDGAARIKFADDTSYTIKPQTLVTVEENNVTRDQVTTAVRINTGAVDLRTTSSPNSRTAVSSEDFTAQIRPNSSATVKTDPDAKQSELTMQAGSADVQHGQEHVEIGQFQRAVIPSSGPITKTDVLAPPDLSEPTNLAPIVAEVPKAASIHFEWKPVKNAVSYTLRISPTNMFTRLAKEVKTVGTFADVSGLDAGEYFWNVTATDEKRQNSDVRETFKFTIFAQGKAQEMLLEIEGTQLHGRMAEIYGRTEPGAALILNGQPVPNIGADGKFRYFTEALEPGEHTIVIVGQNRRGGTARQQVTIVVPK